MLILFYSLLLAGGLNATAGVIVEPAPSATATVVIDLSALDQQHYIQLNVAEFVSIFLFLILAALRKIIYFSTFLGEGITGKV